MIAKCNDKDFTTILEIINDGASAFREVIPANMWHEPYMTSAELKKQIAEGVEFWCYHENGTTEGVMGIQFKGNVTLIRHAYVITAKRNKGIGSKLLEHLLAIADAPVLIGTWIDAIWAIAFYEKHGFYLVPEDEKNYLLHKYWSISEQQVEASVVLANKDWKERSSFTQ